MRATKNLLSNVRAPRVVLSSSNQCGLALHRPQSCLFRRASTPTLRSMPGSFLQTRGKKTAPIFEHIPAAVPVARQARDEEIEAPFVRVVMEDSRLSEPQLTSTILASIDRKEEVLVLVADEETDGPPICRIISKKRLSEVSKKKSKKNANPNSITKTIELNWAIDPNDLSHRLEKMRGFLRKGNRVEVLLAPKRKGRQATDDEAQAVLKTVRECVASVDGAKEWREMEGKVLRQLTIYAVGKTVE